MNVNINNALVKLTNNLPNANKLNSLKNGDTSSFIKMMTMMLQNGNLTEQQSIVDTNIVDTNIKDVLLGGNFNQNMSIKDLGISNSDILALLNTDKDEDDIGKKGSNIDNLIAMMFSVPQDMTPSKAQNIIPQIPIINTNQGIYQNVSLDNTISNNLIDNGRFESLENLKGYETNIQELVKSFKPANNENFEGKFILKTGDEVEQQSNLENQNSAITDTKMLNGTEVVKSNATTLKETLLAEVNKSKEDFKDEIDLSKISVEEKKITFTDNNKIIKVTDEASQIKSTVLSQVKDQIISMAEDGTQEVKMKLYPENLGEIDIKMSFEKQKMTVEIGALNKDTEKLLISHANELTSILNKLNDSFVNVVVKSNENQLTQFEQNNFAFNYQKGENANQNQNSRRNYQHNPNIEADDEKNIIAEMINLRNLKLNKVV